MGIRIHFLPNLARFSPPNAHKWVLKISIFQMSGPSLNISNRKQEISDTKSPEKRSSRAVNDIWASVHRSNKSLSFHGALCESCHYPCENLAVLENASFCHLIRKIASPGRLFASNRRSRSLGRFKIEIGNVLDHWNLVETECGEILWNTAPIVLVAQSSRALFILSPKLAEKERIVQSGS